MLPLRQLQLDFSRALFDEMPATLKDCVRGDYLDAERRLAIYRNNVFSNLREALRAAYPVIERLVGTEFFDYAADRFIRRQASLSGDIEDYGMQFATFLAQFPAANALAYLPDTARLEWACHQVFYAAEHAPPALEKLAATPAEHFGQLRFQMHPASALLASDYPVHRIREVNQPEFEGDHGVDLSQGGVTLLVRRHHFQVEVEPLGAGEFAMLEALAAAHTVAEAFAQATQADPAFDLQLFLQRHLVAATLVDVSGDPPCH